MFNDVPSIQCAAERDDVDSRRGFGGSGGIRSLSICYFEWRGVEGSSRVLLVNPQGSLPQNTCNWAMRWLTLLVADRGDSNSIPGLSV
jgi:hypothetical protein